MQYKIIFLNHHHLEVINFGTCFKYIIVKRKLINNIEGKIVKRTVVNL